MILITPICEQLKKWFLPFTYLPGDGMVGEGVSVMSMYYCKVGFSCDPSLQDISFRLRMILNLNLTLYGFIISVEG